MSVGHYYTFGVFFKPVSADFGWSRTITSFASSIVIFTSGILGLTTGFLTDKYGPRKVVSASGLLMAIGYFLLSRLGTFPGIPVLIQFYLFYLVVGVGMSASSAPLTATVSRWFHEKRGQALGLMTVGGGLGQFLMPPFASYMIFSADWQMAYFVIGVLMAVVIISTAQLLRRDPSAKGLQPYGQQQTTIVTGKPPPPVFTVKQAIHTRTFWIIFIVAALNLITQVMVMMHLVNYATDPGIGISPTIAATFIAVIGFANVIGKLVMGPVSDHIGRKATLAICYTLAGTTMVWLIFARQIWMFYVFSALFGFAYGGWIPMFPAMMADLFGMASIGALTGIIHMGNAIGGAIGPILGGYIFDLTKSYLIAFILGAIVFYVAAVLILSVKPPQHKHS
ncbi:MAG: MFS transporter [Dehalococcoidia bacterium]|nr:MFS transporter [Dehalococcoidia bacterium]